MNLTKTPTREYPAGTAANSNAAFRLALTMTLLEDGYFGTHTLKDPDVWWDEYAVDVRPGSANFGKAVRKGDIDGIHQHRGWLGKPIAPFRRVYNDADFAPAKSLIGANTFDQGLNGWDSTNVSISRVTSGARDGSGALRASEMRRFTENEMGAFVKSKNFSVSGGATYTLAFSARASETREIRVAVGNDSYRIAVGKEWRRYVLTFRPTQSGATAVKFGLGGKTPRCGSIPPISSNAMPTCSNASSTTAWCSPMPPGAARPSLSVRASATSTGHRIP